MPNWSLRALAFVVAVALGVVVRVASDNVTASYMVAVLSLALGAAALIGAGKAAPSIRSRLRIEDVTDAKITSIRVAGTSSRSVSSDVDVRRVRGGEVKGVDAD